MSDLVKQAEQSTIGAMLTIPRMIPDVLQKVAAHDFFAPQHERIFTSIYELWATGEEISPLTVSESLKDKKFLDSVGGLPYLFSCIEQAPTSSSVISHAELVAEHATRRRLALAGEVITQNAWDGTVEESVTKAQSLIDSVYRPTSDTVHLVPEHISDTLDHLRDVREGKIPKGIPTGFSDLDKLIGGFSGGQMIIIAARPGVGKTTIATDIMREASINQGIPTMIYSLEMSEREMHMRLLSAESEINITTVKSGRFYGEDQTKLENGVAKLSEAPIYIDDSPEITMVDITAKTKMLVKKHGIKMIVVDYLQLLKSGTKQQDRQQEVSEFSRQMKLLAKMCNIPVIAVAQLNRGVESRGEGAVPKLSDLRESGSLEQDADIVLLLNRMDAQDADAQRAGETDIIVAKHRGGPTGTVTVANQLHYSRFSNFNNRFDSF